MRCQWGGRRVRYGLDSQLGTLIEIGVIYYYLILRVIVLLASETVCRLAA